MYINARRQITAFKVVGSRVFGDVPYKIAQNNVKSILYILFLEETNIFDYLIE